MLCDQLGSWMVRALVAGSLLRATIDLTSISNADGTEVAGVLGFAMLFLLDRKTAYRDGPVDFTQEAERCHGGGSRGRSGAEDGNFEHTRGGEVLLWKTDWIFQIVRYSTNW